MQSYFFSTCNFKICILGLSLQGFSEELAADLCLSRAWKKLGHSCNPQGPFGIYTMICWYTHATQSTTEGSRETVNCAPREKFPHEALKYCGQWVSCTEARKVTAKNFPGLAACQRYFTALFVFPFLKQAGLGSLISVTYGGCTSLPVCVGINTLNTLTAVMCSFQGKIPGGHETEMGRLRGNMVYRELPSQGWHGTSVFTWLHYWAVKVTMLLYIQTHIQGQSWFLIFLPWMCIAF